MPDKKTQEKKQAQPKKTPANNQSSTASLEELVADDTQIEITIAWHKIKPIYQKKLKEQAAKLKLKGFRQGKAPLAVAEKEIGYEKMFNLVLQEMLPAEYEAAIKAGKYQPITRPEFQAISVNKDNDWIVKAFFSEKPELKIDGYKKIAKKAKIQAEEEIKKVEEEAKKGDAKKKKAEKTKKETSKRSTKDSPKQEKMNSAQKKDAIAQKVVSTLVAQLQPSVPRLLIRESAQREMENLVQRLKNINLDLETFLKSRQMTQEQLSYQLTYSSLSQLQVELLFQAIVQKEEFEVSQKEVDEFIAKTEDEKIKKQMMTDKSYQEYLKSVLLKQKVIDSLLAL
ncbi:MAG: Trigger factor [Microgenomates bacterium 39_7]|nr:MAG: Trigger factor [Microgenomates bacterium 39_7]